MAMEYREKQMDQSSFSEIFQKSIRIRYKIYFLMLYIVKHIEIISRISTIFVLYEKLMFLQYEYIVRKRRI